MKETKAKTDKNTRSLLLDALRGFTVVLMIIFHASFDLDYFKFISVDIVKDPFWYAFPRLIVFLFLFTTGCSLYLAHKHKINWKPFVKREMLIGFWALVISVTTYILFPENWIYFGTLHAIFTISLFSLPFLKRPILSLIIGLLLFTFSIFWDKTIPWIELNHQSWDHISVFPWIGASLLGIFAAHKNFHQIQIPENKITKVLSYMGKHSLFIYITHQPLLFGIILSFIKVKSFLH